MTVYSVDVEVSTHDDLKRGVTALPLLGSEHSFTRITVEVDDGEGGEDEADPDGKAVLIATQIAACHHMPTAAYLRV